VVVYNLCKDFIYSEFRFEVMICKKMAVAKRNNHSTICFMKSLIPPVLPALIPLHSNSSHYAGISLKQRGSG
jgi:hypothetical protein